MTRKKRPRIPWPDDKPEHEVLVTAHRSLARGILGLLQNGEWENLGQERIHLLGNYLLLSSLIAPDEPAYHHAQEKQVFVEGMIEAGFTPEQAANHVQSTYVTPLPRRVHSLDHIPEDSPEVIERKWLGRVVSRELDASTLCSEAVLLDKKIND